MKGSEGSKRGTKGLQKQAGRQFPPLSFAAHPLLLLDIFQNFIPQRESLKRREFKPLSQEYRAIIILLVAPFNIASYHLIMLADKK